MVHYYILFLISFLVVLTYACLLILGVESLLLLITFSDTHTHRRCCQPAASSVHCTTSCKHSLVLLRMGEINARNMLSWLTLLINCYCFICLVVYIIAQNYTSQQGVNYPTKHNNKTQYNILLLYTTTYFGRPVQPTSGRCRINKNISHLPADGWSGRPKNFAVHNKRLIYQIWMLGLVGIINTLLKNTKRDCVTQYYYLVFPR